MLEINQKHQSKNKRPVIFSVCGIMLPFDMCEYMIKKYAFIFVCVCVGVCTFPCFFFFLVM